jgi:two-component system chemotaxis response regulator CheB
MNFGKLTPFTCPECHGVLTELKDGQRPRYRCHTGHAFSSDGLLTTVTENIEDSMWNTIRGIEESIMLLDHMGQHFSETGQTDLAMLYFQKSREAKERAHMLRTALIQHEQLSGDQLRDLADGDAKSRIANG